jgi:dipeptidyl aminopeptidase/acylaminoacyl peptidase
MTREDLLDFKFMRGLDISPDGARVVYALEWIDREDNKHYSNLWLYDRATDTHTQFTFGKQKDCQPVFSPGGKQIAFCSSRDKQDGIYLISTGGGAERKVIRARGSFASLGFSSDGTQLLFAFRKAYNAPTEETEAKIKESQKPPVYRHITRLWYRLDGEGWRPEDGYHVWRYDLHKREPIQVTRGKRDELEPVFTPDGRAIAYVTNRHRDPDKYPQYQDIYICDLHGGHERRIAKPDGPAESLSISPNGKYLAFLGHDNPEDAWGATNYNLWVAPLHGGRARNLTRKFNTTLYDPTISDTGEAFGSPCPPIWSADSSRIYFTAPWHGANDLYSIPRRGGRPEPEARGRWDIQGYRADARRRTFALAISDPGSAGDLWLYEARKGRKERAQRVTTVNAGLFRKVARAKPQTVWFKSYDGTRVQGWILKPPNFRPGRKYPAIVEVHGGPRAQYGHVLFHEMQYLAGLGYVVFYCNPRGSQGYGEAFTKCIVGNWGGPDYEDVMAGTDFLCSQPYVDARRVGITGGSYGGYMTNWVIGHTHRFRAAVTQRSVVNLISFFGSSDIGYSDAEEFLAVPWANGEELVRMSPITYAHKIRTPLLIIHSENDLRCPIEQAEQLFVWLKYLGRRVEFVRFPEEPHGLSRGGRPDRRMARLQFISNWFDKYLK